MARNHTPGEWVYLDIGEVVVQGDIEVTIATIDYGRDRAEEDGALIASAPEMLAALLEARAVLDNPNLYRIFPVGAARTAILAALEKAGAA